MADVEFFDADAIDAAFNAASGRKPIAAKAPTAGASLEGLNPDLAQRLQQAQKAHKQRFGKDLQITSGVRTREQQQDLYNRWKAGEKGIYDPINPADYPNQKIFHTNAVDISTSVPESFLNEFGIHRPLGSKDPVHAVLMGKAAPTKTVAPETTAPTDGRGTTIGPEIVFTEKQDDTGGNEFFDADAIDAAFDVAKKEKREKENKPGVVTSKVQSLLRSGAGLADTIIGGIQTLPGTVASEVAYGITRAGEGLGIVEPGTAQEARLAGQKMFVEPYARPVGEYFGVTETPEYKGEASQQFMKFIGENFEKGADWISKKLGLPKADVENMMGTMLAGVPGAKQTKLGQAVSREVGYATEAAKQAGGKVLGAVGEVTPGPVRRAAAGTVEAIAPGTIKAKPAPAAIVPEPANVPPFQPGRASVGAATVPDATTIKQALTSATPEFQQLYGNMPLDKVNTPVVLRHLEADVLPVPIRLTEGQATGDVVKLSREQNLRGSQPEFARRFNEQNQQLVENVPLIREKAAPDVYATKTIESSQAIIDAYKVLDDARNVEIRAAYKVLEDANGGQFPVDGQAIVRNADALLSQKMKSNFVPSEIAADLDRFRKGEPMTFEQFEALRTNLAAEARKAQRAGDGNREAAVNFIRDAMEELPLKGEAANLKPLADQARALAKARFDELKKDPAYKAAVDDAVSADKYFNKFVINGDRKNINTMIDALGRDSLGHQHIKAGTINHLSDKAGIMDGRGNFSQANYNKALKQLDDFKKFETIFDPESQLQLRTLGNVASYTQFQPRGSFVNNSNTLVGYLANKAAGGLEAAGNVAGLKTFGYPIGSEARRVIRSARERREAEAALKPGAGSTLKDISEGKK